MDPALRVSVVTAVHGHASVQRSAVLCSLEAQWRGGFALLLPCLQPYTWSRGDALFHPVLGAQRSLVFLTRGVKKRMDGRMQG